MNTTTDQAAQAAAERRQAQAEFWEALERLEARVAELRAMLDASDRERANG